MFQNWSTMVLCIQLCLMETYYRVIQQEERGLRRRIRTVRWRQSFYSPTRVSLMPILPVSPVSHETFTMQQASSHLQLERPTMQQASSHLQLERQTVASFGGGLISKMSCNLSLWCITMVANTTDIVMCYEERVWQRTTTISCVVL